MQTHVVRLFLIMLFIEAHDTDTLYWQHNNFRPGNHGPKSQNKTKGRRRRLHPVRPVIKVTTGHPAVSDKAAEKNKMPSIEEIKKAAAKVFDNPHLKARSNSQADTSGPSQDEFDPDGISTEGWTTADGKPLKDVDVTQLLNGDSGDDTVQDGNSPFSPTRPGMEQAEIERPIPDGFKAALGIGVIFLVGALIWLLIELQFLNNMIVPDKKERDLVSTDTINSIPPAPHTDPLAAVIEQLPEVPAPASIVDGHRTGAPGSPLLYHPKPTRNFGIHPPPSRLPTAYGNIGAVSDITSQESLLSVGSVLRRLATSRDLDEDIYNGSPGPATYASLRGRTFAGNGSVLGSNTSLDSFITATNNGRTASVSGPSTAHSLRTVTNIRELGDDEIVF